MKKILTFALTVSMMASLAASASALEYSITPPKDFDFGGDIITQRLRTSIPLLGRPVPARTQMPYCSRLSRTAASAKWTPRPSRTSNG